MFEFRNVASDIGKTPTNSTVPVRFFHLCENVNNSSRNGLHLQEKVTFEGFCRLKTKRIVLAVLSYNFLLT
jgi:hypothetical protein